MKVTVRAIGDQLILMPMLPWLQRFVPKIFPDLDTVLTDFSFIKGDMP